MNPELLSESPSREARESELAPFSDEVLLQHVVKSEEADDEVAFGSRRRRSDGGGRHLAFVREVTRRVSVVEIIAENPGRPWRLVYEGYCDLVVANWEETWESCRTASFTSLLHEADSARFLAFVAWRQRKAVAPSSNRETPWGRLNAMTQEERTALLAAFGRDGAASCAFEGIEIDPALLAR